MRTLTRIKKQRRPFTKEVFYIYSLNGIFQLRDTKSHAVISTAGTVAEIKRCLVVILNRYKNYDHYLKAFSSMSEKAVTDKQALVREKEYKREGHKYIKEIEDLLKEYYLEKDAIEDRRKGLIHNMPVPVRPQRDTITEVVPQRIPRRKKRTRLV